MDRFELTQKLLDGTFTPGDAKENNIQIISATAKPELDTMQFVSGDSSGSILTDADRIAPKTAMYTDEEGNVVHLGVVIPNPFGEIMILSKITGSTFVILHSPELPPVDVPGKIDWEIL